MAGVGTGDPNERFREQVQGLICEIIASGAPRARMTALLLNVPKEEAWPAIRAELDELLGGQGGEGES